MKNKIALPDYVAHCMHVLESNGFQCYAVGGCVRDCLLGLIPHDYDLCTDALPHQIRGAFSDHALVLSGEKHGTVGVITPQGVVEITTFRTEGGYADSRHPDWVEFVKDIQGDLARRDFTVNAMAYSPAQGLVDPFGGQQDLASHRLRAVGDALTRFSEDALRILRGIRFAVRYGLLPEENTLQAMLDCTPLLSNIAQERIFDELCQFLPRISFEDILRFKSILGQVIPELLPTMGFEQHSTHHLYDVFTHTACVTAAVPAELSLRWAALLHDIGKVTAFTMDEQGQGHFYGHAEVSAQMADSILARLKAPNAMREEVVFLITHHMTPLLPERKSLRRRLSKWGASRLSKLLLLQQADFGGKGVASEPHAFEEIQAMIAEIVEADECLTLKDLKINGHDLMDLGLQGPAIGDCLHQLLMQVLDEAIPNEKAALLKAAERINL